MEDINKNEELQVKGAKGGGGSSKKVTQNVTVVAPTRQPVIADDNLFSVAFAKTVYAVSEGEIEGFPNSIEKDVYLDGVPIQNPDGTSNFDGYTLDHRVGDDETQTPIEGFSTTENTVGVSTEVTQAVGPIVRAITDKDIERCRVIISHPALQSQNPKTATLAALQSDTTLKSTPMVVPIQVLLAVTLKSAASQIASSSVHTSLISLELAPGMYVSPA